MNLEEQWGQQQHLQQAGEGGLAEGWRALALADALDDAAQGRQRQVDAVGLLQAITDGPAALLALATCGA